MKNAHYFGLTIFYPSDLKRPADIVITEAIKEKFNLKQDLKATHIRAIKQGYGNSVELEYDYSTEKWSAKEIFYA